MNEELQKILCDPADRSILEFRESKLLGKVNSYTVVGGVPVLLQEGLSEKDTKILESGSQKYGFSWAEKHWFDLKLNTLFDKPAAGTKLMSYGSGSPLEKKYLTDLGYEVISIDINPKYKGVDVICDGHYLPFKDNTFDVVASFEVFEHLHSPWLAIQEVSRVLKPGGVFIGSVAFIKEFHHSYFHISHWGMLHLLEYGGLKCEVIYGGQNLFGRVISQIIPLFGSNFTQRIYGLFGRTVFALRSALWAFKNRMSSDTKLEKFDKVPFSFGEYDQIKYSPAIMFKAIKPVIN